MIWLDFSFWLRSSDMFLLFEVIQRKFKIYLIEICESNCEVALERRIGSVLENYTFLILDLGLSWVPLVLVRRVVIVTDTWVRMPSSLGYSFLMLVWNSRTN